MPSNLYSIQFYKKSAMWYNNKINICKQFPLERRYVMYRIIKKTVLNPTVVRMEIEAPLVAKKSAGRAVHYSENR